MTINEMKETVRKHAEAEESLEALRKLMGHLRADGGQSAMETMLGHVMGTAVAPRIPQATKNALAEKFWIGVVALYEAADAEVTTLNNIK